MFPAAFAYHRPATLDEAIALLARYGEEAKLLAGGHSLIPTLKLRLSKPGHLIDLGGIDTLKGVAVVEGQLRIGAMTTHWQVESSPVVKAALPYLSEVAGGIADPQVRNRGTIGGSVVNADPAADYPASILALDAELICTGKSGDRAVAAARWLTGLMSTALEDGEILREVRFPLLPARSCATYLKLPHPASRFAVVGVAANASFSAGGTCERIRVAITGAGSMAVRATAVEARLSGQRLDTHLVEAAAAHACDETELGGDLHYSADDKAQLCRVCVKRAVTRLRDLYEARAFQPSAQELAGSR